MASAAPYIQKMSFAKVAASGTRENNLVAIPRIPIQTKPTTSSTAFAKADATNMNNEAHAKTNGSMEAKVVEGLKELKIETKTPSLVVNGTGSTITERSSKNGNSQTPSDDNSQRADSVSELGTKPPSLDGKSITSGTTYALDEKESLRPDDSASVKAAAEDDDAFSVRGSLIAPGSRMGSEVAAARFGRIQIGDMPLQRNAQIASGVVFVNQGFVTPTSSGLEKQQITEAKLPLVSGTETPDVLNGNNLYRQNPDEKLLEAMQSPKDRLFLLRLEAQVITFVQESKEPFMDLPPCNSFCRMLTHKLADYYHMTHSFEAVAGGVRIYRTPFCRVPPPLSGIVNQSSSSSPAPAILPRKIMRRGDTDSGSPSKATSEAGSGDDKGPIPKEKMTREEREEAYNRARERIFGNMEKKEGASETDDNNGVSRASSVSAKEKAGVSKRKPPKQRRDDSESFDSRSQYIAYCGPQQPAWGGVPQYIPITNAQYNVASPYQQQPYSNPLQPIYGPNQSYPAQSPHNGYAPSYNQMPVPSQYAPQPVPQPAQAPPQHYQPHSTPVATYGQPVPQNIPPQGWQQQSFNQSPYQARAAPVPVNMAEAPLPGPPGPNSGIPYPFGALPANINPRDPKSMHPIPGSYNRHSFNPKTQSFVPGNNGMPPMPNQGVPYGGQGGPNSHHESPQFNQNVPHVAQMGSPHMGYAGYQQQQQQPGYPQQQQQQQPAYQQQHQPMQQQPNYPPNGASYGMARQGSNQSLPPYHHPLPQMPPQQQPPQQHMPHGLPQGPIHSLPPNPTMHNIPNKPNMSNGQGPYSTLAHYGNPSTLPQKPNV